MLMRITVLWIGMPCTVLVGVISCILYTEDVDINFLPHTRTHAHIYVSHPSKPNHSHLRNSATPHNNRNTDPTAGTGAVQNRKTPLRGLNPDSSYALPI
jgi:hypothetical protein